MNDFDFDVMTKKRIARGAAARKCGSKSRRCTLPSDYLTDAQKKARNGKMSTYNLSKPMTYEQFKLMPRDLQREYLLKLRNDMHASARVIAQMFGCSYETVRVVIRDLGINTGGKRLYMNLDQLLRWNNWLSGDAANTPVAVTEPETETETETEAEAISAAAEETEAETISAAAEETEDASAPVNNDASTEEMKCAALLGGKLNLRGTASEILSRLAIVFDAESDAQMFVSVKFSVGNGAES